MKYYDFNLHLSNIKIKIEKKKRRNYILDTKQSVYKSTRTHLHASHKTNYLLMEN